jgi:DNA-binding transcriptional regulator YhcF (GntR family)
MSVRAISWALDEVEGLTATQKCILIALADRCNQDHECWPSYTDLLRRTGADRHTIARAISKFVAKGLITKRRRFGSSTVYKLCISEHMHTSISADMHTSISADMPTLTVKEPSKESNARFEEFWTAYPRKLAKARAEIAWRNLKKKEQEAALVGVKTWPFSDEKQYIPYPATWLNQKRWEDDETTTTEGFVL